ncbi:cytochrome P450 1A1-like [Amphiura filiformis]|uniref:cytochrome P450 1A1-like n=1 Tax=Amphiura filiformis TaxID=82378 RepID=UPI003B21B111
METSQKIEPFCNKKFCDWKKLESIVHEVTELIGKRIDEQHGKPIDPKQVVCLGIYTMLGRLCFAHKYELDDPRITWFVRLSRETLEALGVGMPADFFPVLRFLPTPGIRKLKQLLEESFNFLCDELKLHRESFDPCNIRDIFDSLLLAQKETIDESSDLVDSLTDTHLVGTVGDIFGGKYQSNTWVRAGKVPE